MYKDKEKQKEAVRKAVEKHRKGITSEGITQQGITLHSGPRVRFENGSYIHIVKLVELKSRGLLEYLVEHAKIGADNLRVGVNGPTITECKELLEVTA